MEIMEIKKELNKINSRIYRIKQYHEEQGLDMTFFKDRLFAASQLEGVIFSNPYRISIAKVNIESINELTINSLNQLIPTMSEFRSLEEEYIKANMEENVDLSNKTDQEVAAMAGVIIKIYASYNDALQDFYNIRDDINMDAIISEEVKQQINGLLMQIDMAIHHKGTFALPVEKVEANKKLIGELAGKIEALKKGE